jgi:hypothetical protein
MIRVHGCEPDFIQDGGDDMRALSSRLLLALSPVPCLASPFPPPQSLLDWRSPRTPPTVQYET